MLSQKFLIPAITRVYGIYPNEISAIFPFDFPPLSATLKMMISHLNTYPPKEDLPASGGLPPFGRRARRPSAIRRAASETITKTIKYKTIKLQRPCQDTRKGTKRDFFRKRINP